MTDDRPFTWPAHWLPALDAIRCRVASICRRWDKDQNTAEDMVQATLLKMREAARDEGRARPGAAPPRVFDDPDNWSPGLRPSRLAC